MRLRLYICSFLTLSSCSLFYDNTRVRISHLPIESAVMFPKGFSIDWQTNSTTVQGTHENQIYMCRFGEVNKKSRRQSVSLTKSKSFVVSKARITPKYDGEGHLMESSTLNITYLLSQGIDSPALLDMACRDCTNSVSKHWSMCKPVNIDTAAITSVLQQNEIIFTEGDGPSHRKIPKMNIQIQREDEEEVVG
ncbi:MAG: hypothetical protein K2Q26_01885 [Bdellovibrionales bacterium]|nr:hypothetical protein [Bdellovibrionales bacterium]